ncbi:MAG: DUF2878 domain-containing protein [Gammaproteobacteria bacterium]|nr:DUF2878 domain-containing protein [Gammaproteobacteria bacterium]NNL51144.1 DUF2878 domain-containing protein [Woeseiaceae bacterium]
MPMMVNFIAFQIGWFSSVIGAANQMPWLGPVVLLFVLAIHLGITSRPTSELLLVIACGVVGIVFDSLLVAFDWVSYPSGQFSEILAPYWIVTMWMLFGTTLNVSMGWLKGRPALAAVFGAIGGPASYIAGQKLGGIILVDYMAAMIALAIGWAVFMPLLLALAEKLDVAPSETAAQEVHSS